jgi:hypothetical protein
MVRKVGVSCSILVFGLFPVAAQISPEVSFCPAGVQADGFIDFSKLPQAPTSGSVEATIPVSGVGDLSATFKIPSSASPAIVNPASYSVRNSTVLSLGFDVNPTIVFSHPVRGVSVTLQTTGRLGHHFQMAAYSSTGDISVVPPQAAVDSSGWDYPVSQFSTSPLQIRSTSANLIAIVFRFDSSPEEYSSYQLVNLRVESGLGPDPSIQVPTQGLKEWLRADRLKIEGPVSVFSSTSVGNVAIWPDQSGHGSDAVPVNSSSSPTPLLDGPTCTPVVSFNGTQWLKFNLPINGWSGMTVFLAGAASAEPAGWWESQAVFWDETLPWGTTFFTLSQTAVSFRFGTTQVGNQSIYVRPANIGGDLSITTAIHNNDVDSLYVNGVLVLQQDSKYSAISGTVPTATIGAGLNNTFFKGKIGEILIYDRALSQSEREIVERYLKTKYGVL